jgi:hypothetical protein
MSPSVRLNTKEAQALGTPKVEIGLKVKLIDDAPLCFAPSDVCVFIASQAAADAPKKSGWINKAKDIDWDKVR